MSNNDIDQICPEYSSPLLDKILDFEINIFSFIITADIISYWKTHIFIPHQFLT